MTPTPRTARLTVVRLAWALLIAFTAWRCIDIAIFDFRDHPISGDQTNFVMQAQSLLHGGNLTYDADDLQRWTEFGWADKPYGLFFRTVEDGWTFAKPYGYSAYLVPFMWIFGDVTGIAVGNAVLLALTMAIVVALLRLRLSGAIVPMLAGVFVFMSATQFYGWVVHTELFLAVLLGLSCWILIRALDSDSPGWGVAGTVVAAFLFSEKATTALVVGPLILVVLHRSTAIRRMAVIGSGAVTTLLFVSPYLWSSGGAHWNPYQGERYYSRGGVPFAGPGSGVQGGWDAATREQFFNLDIIGRFSRAPELVPQSALTTLVGRHTGLLVFAPLAFLVLVRTARRFKVMPTASKMLFLGVSSYLVLYVLMLPHAYTGGSSLGNRYFVQISLAVVAMLALDPPRAVVATRMALAAAMISLVLTWPHHASPRNAYSERLNVTTPLQRLLPPETQLVSWTQFDTD